MVEFADDLDDITFTTDLYSISMDTDRHMIQEFQALQALSDPHQKPSLKIQQSEAKKEATRMLRAKFRYPAKDPAPNAFKDTRTELEKTSLRYGTR